MIELLLVMQKVDHLSKLRAVLNILFSQNLVYHIFCGILGTKIGLNSVQSGSRNVKNKQ